jgi:hypothetical protein
LSDVAGVKSLPSSTATMFSFSGAELRGATGVRAIRGTDGMACGNHAQQPPDPILRRIFGRRTGLALPVFKVAAATAIVLDGTGEAVLRSLFKVLKNSGPRASDGERGDQLRLFQARS